MYKENQGGSPEELERMENYLWDLEELEPEEEFAELDDSIDWEKEEFDEEDLTEQPLEQQAYEEIELNDEDLTEQASEEQAYEEDSLDAIEDGVENNPDDTAPAMGFQMIREQINLTAVEHIAKIAVTEEEFAQVIQEMDRMDRNRERRERYHEIGREDMDQEVQCAKDHYICPEWMGSPMARLLRSGQFLDYLYDCPYEMHKLVADPAISDMVAGLKENQKEVLYYLALRLCSTAQVAGLTDTTDRNVRKIRDTYTKKLQRQLYGVLSAKQKSGQSLSLRELEFIEKYAASREKNGKAARVRPENKYPVRKKVPQESILEVG